MKYTKIPTNLARHIQLNAGILVKTFVPATGSASDILGATTGGVTFNPSPSYSDFGDDIDNCPKNTMELKKLDSYDVNMSGTFVSVSAETAKTLAASADSEETSGVVKIVPRNEVLASDFEELWWVGDYSDVNTGEDAGFIAIHMLNTLSTGGFQITSSDKSKGNFAFTFTGHYSIQEPDVVPFEIYIKEGTQGA